MRITYHEGKRALTLVDRGLDFADAIEVFKSRNLTQTDGRRDYGEERSQTIGWLHGSMVMVVWTLRGDARHVISMRKCNDREQRRYQERLGEA
jgi:uncharacterized DUF497 family protein